MPDHPHGSRPHADAHAERPHAARRHAHHAAHAAAHAHSEHEGAPEWLISFADMVMLMMGFFVILFALNVQPKGGNPGGGGEQHEGVANEPDLVDFAIAVRRAFHNEVDLNSTDPADQVLIQRILSERSRETGETSADGTRGDDRSVRSVRPSERYGQGTHVLFDRKSAELGEAASATLDDLARQLRGQSMVIEVRGHVGVGESYGDPERGMELAIDRALMAAKRLAAGGVDWWRLRVEAAGSNERLEPTPVDQAGDARNARVEVRVLDELAAPRGGTADATSGRASSIGP